MESFYGGVIGFKAVTTDSEQASMPFLLTTVTTVPITDAMFFCCFVAFFDSSFFDALTSVH